MPRQDSLYEQLFPLSVVMKQRFVDNFSGDTLNERWTTYDETGANVFAMSDAVDGGFQISNDGSPTGERGGIAFNDKRQYEQTGCVWISVCKWTDIAVLGQSGLKNAVGDQGLHYFVVELVKDGTFFRIEHNDGAGGRVSTDTALALDTNYHIFKGQLTSSDGKLSIDGVLGATATSNLPAAKLQPLGLFVQDTSGTTGATGSVNYFEAYNT